MGNSYIVESCGIDPWLSVNHLTLSRFLLFLVIFAIFFKGPVAHTEYLTRDAGSKIRGNSALARQQSDRIK